MKDFGHVVPHTAGFNEAAMKKTFEGAGLTNFEFSVAIPKVNLHKFDVQIFLARGVRANV